MTALPANTLPLPEAASERRLSRIRTFQAGFRKRILQTIAGSAAVEDLTDSFPALLFALATGFGSPLRRGQTLRLIEHGAPLREAADTLGLPWWLRRLPAEAFTEPLDDLPTSPAFALRIAPFVPCEAAAARVWLSAVLYGYRACHEAYALWIASWIAKQYRAFVLPMGEDNLRLMAAWAWHADQPDTPGHRLIRRPWTPIIGHRRAFEEMNVWRQRAALAQILSCQGRASSPAAGSALGYDFVPLITAEDYIAEAIAMDNCLDQFADRVAEQFSRVFSIRRDGRCLADLEIGLHPEEASMLTIRQLRGPRNRRAPPEIWKAAYVWLGNQPLRPVLPQDLRTDALQLRQAAKRLWQPYLDVLAGRPPEATFRQFVVGPLDERTTPPTRNRALAATASGPRPPRRAPARAIAV